MLNFKTFKENQKLRRKGFYFYIQICYFQNFLVNVNIFKNIIKSKESIVKPIDRGNTQVLQVQTF